MILANQLFKPKVTVNEEIYSPLQLIDRDCSVNGYFRDLSNGNVVFCIDYIDFYEQAAREQPPEDEKVDDTDW